MNEAPDISSRIGVDGAVCFLQGKLSGFGIEEQLPTIALVAHYDSFAASPVSESGALFTNEKCVCVIMTC